MIYTAIDKKSKKIHCIILLKNIDRRSGKVYTFYGEKAMEIKYYKHKLEKLLVVDEVVTIHYFEFDKNYKNDGESHDFWELVYADKESLTARSDDKTIVIEQGEMLFHKPNEFHSLSANGQSAPNVFIMSFVCKSRAMRFFENKKIKLDKSLVKFIYFIIEESKKTFNLPYSNPELKKMEFLPRPALGGQQLMENFLEILLISIMRDETEKENPDVVFLPEEEFGGRISQSVIRVLNDKVDEKLCVQDICDKLNYNKSYIFRQFKKDTGSTIMVYFTRLKIEKAKKLLRETKMNVTQISDSLSFDTPNYFTKTFKKVTGVSPLKYKRIYVSRSAR